MAAEDAKMDSECDQLAKSILKELTARGQKLSVAESLTGGKLSSAIVSIPGSSVVYLGGVVAYSPLLKMKILGVSAELIDQEGTVHPQVAKQMAQGVQQITGSDFALATTGVAGPGPAEEHPAGTVYVACEGLDSVMISRFAFRGTRAEIRQQTVFHALQLLNECLEA